MRRSAKSLSLPAAILVAILVAAGLAVGAAGCAGAGSTVKGAISSVASSLPSRSATAGTATTAGQPATTAPAATAAPSASALQSTTAAPAAGSGTSLIWLWILLGAVLAAVLIAWITRVVRRGSSTAADWRSRLVGAYAQGSALHDAMSVAETPGAMAAADAGARWADIQRRADDLAQTLYALRESVPDPADQMRIADTLASLQAARSAMDAERAPGGAGPWQAETVRGRLDAFESSLQALRTDDQRYP